MISLISVISLIIASALGATGALFFKLSSSKVHLDIMSVLTNWRLYLGGFFYLTSTFFFWYVLKNNHLSVVYPFVSLTYIFVELLSMKFLGEKMNMYKWAGIVLIVVGVSFIGIGG